LRAIASITAASSRAASASACASSQAKKGSSPIAAPFTTSARPARYSRSGRVASVSMSANTARGWWNAPTRFLPAGRLTPVLPPTEESTIASSVVGIWMKSMPRIQQAALKPARSPTTPPPSAITQASRVAPSSASAASTRSTLAKLLCASPSSSRKLDHARPSRPCATRPRYSGATAVLLTTSAWRPRSRARQRALSPSRPRPIQTG